MENTNKNQSDFKNNNAKNKSNVGEAASELLNESKILAGKLYDDGLNKVSEAEENVKEYSDELLRKIQENPLVSVLIAGGVGFLLSTLFKK